MAAVPLEDCARAAVALGMGAQDLKKGALVHRGPVQEAEDHPEPPVRVLGGDEVFHDVPQPALPVLSSWGGERGRSSRTTGLTRSE